MSRDNLGNKQTIILHNCLIKENRYDLVITSLKQKIGYIRSKKQTKKKTISSQKKNKSLIEKQFPEHETQFRNLIQQKYKNFKTSDI